MASTNPHADEDARRALLRIVDERMHDDTGRVDLKIVANDLHAWLIGHPSELTARAGRIAVQMVRSFDRARRPAIRKGVQLELFHPRWLIPVGSNVRVLMKKATREDVIQWEAIEANEHAASTTAYAKKASYRADRLSVWTADEHHLEDVERRYFGYVDLIGDDDLDGDEDDDE